MIWFKDILLSRQGCITKQINKLMTNSINPCYSVMEVKNFDFVPLFNSIKSDSTKMTVGQNSWLS